MEAAPQDYEYLVSWGSIYSYDIATSTTVGTGKANTELIIAANGDWTYAASICRDLSYYGYEDWFLPSLSELQEVWNAGILTNPVFYWSSSEGFTEESGWQAWAFTTNREVGWQPKLYDKNSGLPIRAVRRF
jgi:hypothetical protein